jgi:hypothetical protein
MVPNVRWWRAKPTPTDCGRAAWFDPDASYPGFVLPTPFKGNVRVFRDIQAFMTHDGSFSMDLPQNVLDEVTEAGRG